MIIKAGTYRFNDSLETLDEGVGTNNLPFVIPSFSVNQDGMDIAFSFGEFNSISFDEGTLSVFRYVDGNFVKVPMTISSGGESNTIDNDSYILYRNNEWCLYNVNDSTIETNFGFVCQIFTVAVDTEVDDTFSTWFTENTKPYSNNFIGEIIMENTFFNYNESQAKTGYKAAVLYKKQGDTKYRFLCASETVPFPYGTKDTFEYDLLNSSSKGMVEGKNTLEQKEVELLYTPNNAYLFETLKGQVLDFMSLTPDKIGYKFHGKISFRPNDASADIHRGTYTITPMGADEVPYFKAREECLQPLFFADVIPYEVSTTSLPTTETMVKLNLGLVGGYTGAVYKYDTIQTATNKPSGTQTTLNVASGVGSLPKKAGLYIIYAEPAGTDETKYSGCFTLVYIVD